MSGLLNKAKDALQSNSNSGSTDSANTGATGSTDASTTGSTGASGMEGKIDSGEFLGLVLHHTSSVSGLPVFAPFVLGRSDSNRILWILDPHAIGPLRGPYHYPTSKSLSPPSLPYGVAHRRCPLYLPFLTNYCFQPYAAGQPSRHKLTSYSGLNSELTKEGVPAQYDQKIDGVVNKEIGGL